MRTTSHSSIVAACVLLFASACRIQTDDTTPDESETALVEQTPQFEVDIGRPICEVRNGGSELEGFIAGGGNENKNLLLGSDGKIVGRSLESPFHGGKFYDREGRLVGETEDRIYNWTDLHGIHTEVTGANLFADGHQVGEVFWHSGVISVGGQSWGSWGSDALGSDCRPASEPLVAAHRAGGLVLLLLRQGDHAGSSRAIQ
jgi:hypothetical protein